MTEKDIFDKIMELPGLRIFNGVYMKYKETLLYLFQWTYNCCQYFIICTI